jgi:hypothetical protein
MPLLATRFLTRVNLRITSATDLFTNVPAVHARMSLMHTPNRFTNQSAVMSPRSGHAGGCPAQTPFRAFTSSPIVLSSISMARATALEITPPGSVTPKTPRLAHVPYTLFAVNGLIVSLVGMRWLSHARGAG